jgi:hypothetical protein
MDVDADQAEEAIGSQTEYGRRPGQNLATPVVPNVNSPSSVRALPGGEDRTRLRTLASPEEIEPKAIPQRSLPTRSEATMRSSQGVFFDITGSDDE